MAKKKTKLPDNRTEHEIALGAIQDVCGCGENEAKKRLASIDFKKLVELERARNRVAIVVMLYGSPSDSQQNP